jgi:hypothetical protein
MVVIKNYQQRLKSKMFKFDNDITLLILGNIFFLGVKYKWWDNASSFPC